MSSAEGIIKVYTTDMKAIGDPIDTKKFKDIISVDCMVVSNVQTIVFLTKQGEIVKFPYEDS